MLLRNLVIKHFCRNEDSTEAYCNWSRSCWMVYTLLIKNTLFVEKWMRIWLFALFFSCLCPKSLCEPQWRFCGIFHEVIMNIFELALGFNYKCSRWCVSKKHYKFTFLRSKSNFFHLKVESQHEIITDFISLILNAFLVINLFHESSKHIIFNIKIVFDFWFFDLCLLIFSFL